MLSVACLTNQYDRAQRHPRRRSVHQDSGSTAALQRTPPRPRGYPPEQSCTLSAAPSGSSEHLILAGLCDVISLMKIADLPGSTMTFTGFPTRLLD